MALGFDKMTEMSGGRGAGRGVGRDAIDSVILPAAYFSLWAMRRMHERGTKPAHYAEIAAKNWNFGAKNPWSDRQPDHEVTADEVLASRKIAEPVTAMMSCPVDDGAACAVLTTKQNARRLQPGRPLVAPIVSALQSETYARGHTFLGPVVGPPSMTRDTAREAYETSGLGPEDVSLRWCTTPSPPRSSSTTSCSASAGGRAEKMLEERQTHLGGRFPFNTDGGLIARGHPGGPTGLAQIFELTRQLRGEAGPRQVANARVGLAHLVGGGSVCTISILRRE